MVAACIVLTWLFLFFSLFQIVRMNTLFKIFAVDNCFHYITIYIGS